MISSEQFPTPKGFFMPSTHLKLIDTDGRPYQLNYFPMTEGVLNVPDGQVVFASQYPLVCPDIHNGIIYQTPFQLVHVTSTEGLQTITAPGSLFIAKLRDDHISDGHFQLMTVRINDNRIGSAADWGLRMLIPLTEMGEPFYLDNPGLVAYPAMLRNAAEARPVWKKLLGLQR